MKISHFVWKNKARGDNFVLLIQKNYLLVFPLRSQGRRMLEVEQNSFLNDSTSKASSLLETFESFLHFVR